MFAANTATSLTKSIGFTRPKTFQFRKAKEENLNKKQRFKKRTTNYLLGDNGSISSQNLLNNTNGDTMIELGGLGAGVLPPAWVDVYEEAQEKTRKIKDIYDDVQKLMGSRMKIQFGNHEALDAQIEKKNLQATNLLQDCEGHLKEISKMTSPDETPSQAQIRKNIEKVLATQIQEVAMVLRKQQKGFLDKMKEQNFNGTFSELNIGSTAEELEEEDMQEAMMAEDLAVERDEDINQIVENINKLNQLFKDMNRIVIEQGTIVDRIDYNLEKAEDHTSTGKKELVKARKTMESKCGDYCIKVLITLIMVFTVLLIFKFASKR